MSKPTSIRLRKGTMTGYLQHTTVERFSHKSAWFSYPLALIGERGCWLYSGSWRGNAWSKALKELKSIGWTKDDNL